MHLRQSRLIAESIEKLGLDLSGLVVLTEAATGNYAYTAAICAAAGADRVIAAARDTKYGSMEEAESQTGSAADAMGLRGRIEIVSHLADETWGAADIVTNLAALRPIDVGVVNALKATAAVPLMFETWEFREKDIDLRYCWDRGICVLGTNEDHGALRIMDYLGMLVAKKLSEEGIETLGSRILVVGAGKFFFKVCRNLELMGAMVLRWSADFEEAGYVVSEERLSALKGVDAIVIADEPNSERCTIGAGGLISVSDLRGRCPDAIIVQLAGVVSRPELMAYGMKCIPDEEPPVGHMGWSLSELGPKPVIDLHAGGLKVGELLARGRLAGLSPADATEQALRNPVCQDFSPEQKRVYGCPF